MKYRTRTFYTDNQKSEMWDRWQRGESMSSIGRCFNRASSSIFPHLAVTGGIRPPARTRSRLALTLMKREEISRGLAAKSSFRAIARVLQRSPSTISREVHRHAGRTPFPLCDAGEDRKQGHTKRHRRPHQAGAQASQGPLQIADLGSWVRDGQSCEVHYGHQDRSLLL